MLASGILSHLFLILSSAHAGGASSGLPTAAAVWQRLEDLAQQPAQEAADEANFWRHALTSLHAEHPDPDASGALAWLYLFGLPSGTNPFVERDVDRAVRIAREGAHHSPPCARCYALLGLLLSVGYPPLVGAVHLIKDGTGDPRLLILGDVAAHGPATAEAARLPRDIGPPDPAAAAYALAYAEGDALGMLATAYLNQTQLIDLTKLKEPGPNQASSLVSRRPKSGGRASCDDALVNSLGSLAASTIDEINVKSWGPTPEPLSLGVSQQKTDKAFLEHILADAQGSSAPDLAKAANMLESGHVHPSDLPAVARRAANVGQLLALAASKGDRKAAIRTAVELLQDNQTDQATPLLDMVVSSAGSSDDTDHEADVEMSKYYLARFSTSTSRVQARQHAWPHLLRAADLGRQDAKLLVAHAFADGTGVEASEVSSTKEAIRRYRELLPANGTDNVSAASALRNGALNPVQAFAAYNLGVLSLQDSVSSLPEGGAPSHDSKVGQTSGSQRNSSTAELPSMGKGANACSEVQGSFLKVSLSQSGIVRLVVALERRAAGLGDQVGALLLAMLLSDIGHHLGHADSAYLWDKWTAHQPPHLVIIQESLGDDDKASQPCNLRGWWTTTSMDLVALNVTLVYAADVVGGGFEMFNASLAESHLMLEGLEAKEIVQPTPERTEFRHLYSFLWHTTYDAFPAGAPVPVALQPPGAVPHLVEFHHQRGKLVMDKTCNTASVEGMYVNWTFHRLDATLPAEEELDESKMVTASEESTRQPNPGLVAARDFLHCWVRPERYHRSLEANLAMQKNAPPSHNAWEELVSLTVSADCPCYGGFGCRRGDGACEDLAKQWAGAGEELSACRMGSALCRQVPPDLEPVRPLFAATPDVCGFYFHRRAAHAGSIDAMHVLSHAYSNGRRGTPRDASEAFHWSQEAMAAGDLRGHFDVAYSLEFGLGTLKDPERAYEIYQQILTAQGQVGDDLAARAASFLALLAASGRAWASRLFRGTGVAGDT